MTIATNSRFVRLLFLSIPPSLSLCSAKESTYGIIEVLRNDIISIHAPARGATTYLRHTLRIHTISIHAPARGATHISPDMSVRDIKFQSTLPRGERPARISLTTPIVFISIHAPARGATLAKRKKEQEKEISIHAPARGATVCL